MKFIAVALVLFAINASELTCYAGDESSDTNNFLADENCSPLPPGTTINAHESFFCRIKLVSMDGYDSGERRQYSFAMAAPAGYQPCGFTVPKNEPTPAGWTSVHIDQRDDRFDADLTAAGKDSKVFIRIIARFVKNEFGRYKDGIDLDLKCASDPFRDRSFSAGSGHFQNSLPNPTISCEDVTGLGRSQFCSYPGYPSSTKIYCGSC